MAALLVGVDVITDFITSALNRVGKDLVDGVDERRPISRMSIATYRRIVQQRFLFLCREGAGFIGVRLKPAPGLMWCLLVRQIDCIIASCGESIKG